MKLVNDKHTEVIVFYFRIFSPYVVFPCKIINRRTSRENGGKLVMHGTGILKILLGSFIDMEQHCLFYPLDMTYTS